MRKTSALAPMSMPRLGSSISSTFGAVSSALPITTFCWLPPDSDETGSAGSATLIDRSLTSRPHRLGLAREPECGRPARACRGSPSSDSRRPTGSTPARRAGGPRESARGRARCGRRRRFRARGGLRQRCGRTPSDGAPSRIRGIRCVPRPSGRRRRRSRRRAPTARRGRRRSRR